MSLVAKWNGIEWKVSHEQIKKFEEISTGVELDTSTNSDAEGSPPQNTRALKPQKFAIEYSAAFVVGTDPLAEYDKCAAKVGEYAPFFLGGRRFGPENVQLVAANISETTINDKGAIIAAKISLSFEEYAPEASAKKATSGGSSSSGESASKPSAIQSRVNNYSGSAVNVGASTADKQAKKPNNTQLA